MAVIDYQYQHATHEQLTKCLHWCRNELELRNHKILLLTGGTPPRKMQDANDIMQCCGYMQILGTNKAAIWVNTPRLKADNYNPYSTVIHEATHISLIRYGDDSEDVVCIFEPILYRSFCRGNGIKIAKERTLEVD